MAANRVLYAIHVLLFPLYPIQLILMFVLWPILAIISFGLILQLLDLVLMVLICPLIGASWLCNRIEVLRNPIGFVGIPWAIMAYVLACWTPSNPAEPDGRIIKIILTCCWPFCWEFHQFSRGRMAIWSDEANALRVALDPISGVACHKPVLDRLEELALSEPVEP